MRYSITAYKTIAIVSFLILSSVQFFLLYNTYELKNDHYYLTEKNLIKTEYLASIRNDKVFPGGAGILDGFIMKDMQYLEHLYPDSPAKFALYRQRVCDSAFLALRAANNADSLLAAVIKRNHLARNLEYALFIRALDVSFKRDVYISIFDDKDYKNFIDPSVEMDPEYGIRIGGTLQNLYPQSRVMDLTVSSSMDYSYRITFDLFVDLSNRRMTIVRLMLPTFILSLFSILSVVLLFFITFRNWRRQKQLSEMKSDFINSITHEFHTPLTAIIVANRAMQNDKIVLNKENVMPLTGVIQRQADRLKTLIGEVLDLTTMNSRISLKKAEYSVHQLLEELVSDYRYRVAGSNVAFILRKQAMRDRVLLDQFWFATMVLNVFDNAVKYNSNEYKEVLISTFSDRKSIYITISDNGIGMSDEIRKHVFEKFYRNIRQVNGSVKGLGLGLFYVKQAVDAHEWKIELNSREGEGSSFVITIPF
jgi:two-component system phosphate regulon sensor histidine kinase PhoR